nr:hypothetical protein [Bacteroides fragilis]
MKHISTYILPHDIYSSFCVSDTYLFASQEVAGVTIEKIKIGDAKNKFFTLFILLCIIWGCSNNQKKENDVTKTPQKDVYNLIGKRVTSIDSIVSNKT